MKINPTRVTNLSNIYKTTSSLKQNAFIAKKLNYQIALIVHETAMELTNYLTCFYKKSHSIQSVKNISN